MEEAKITELTNEYNAEVETLQRVKDDVPEERRQFIMLLGSKRGKLFRKFHDAIGALKMQAVDTLKRCEDSWKDFEKDQLESFPVGEDEIEKELADFLEFFQPSTLKIRTRKESRVLMAMMMNCRKECSLTPNSRQW